MNILDKETLMTAALAGLVLVITYMLNPLSLIGFGGLDMNVRYFIHGLLTYVLTGIIAPRIIKK